MGLPPANLILFFLSAFVGLWGVSVVVRGVRGRRVVRLRCCPECRADMSGIEGRRCPACEFEAEREEQLARWVRDFRVATVGVLAVAAGIALFPIAMRVRSWELTGYDRGLGVHPLNAVFAGVAAFGVVLAVWAWRGERSKGRRRCPKCWYDMSATLRGGGAGGVSPGLTCPECGHEAGSERALYTARRRRWAAVLGLAVLLVGICGQTVPRALRAGPLGLMPTTALIAGMGWLPTDWLGGPRGSDASLAHRFYQEEVAGWQARWTSERAASLLLSERDPQRLALLLGLADTGDIDRAVRAIEGIGELMLSPGAASWSGKELENLSDSVSAYAGEAVWDRRGGRRRVHVSGALVLRLMQSDSATVRWLGFNLTWTLPPLGDAELWAVLWGLAATGDRQTRSMAASALCSITSVDSAAIKWWMEASRSEDALVRAQAATVVRNTMIERNEVWERLVEMLHEDTEIEVVERAVEALVISESFGERWVANVESELLGDRPHRARIAGAMVREWDIPAAAFGILSKGCEDRAPVVRAASIWAMRRLVERRSVPAAQVMDLAASMLDDADPRVRPIAAVVVLIVATEEPSEGERVPEAVARAKAMETFGVVFDESEFEE